MTLTDYLIECSRNTDITVTDLSEVLVELKRIGNNINQLARKYNAGFGTKEDAKTVEYLMRQVYELMYQVAKE